MKRNNLLWIVMTCLCGVTTIALTACNDDDSTNTPNYSIETGTMDSVALSMSYRGCLSCILSGRCNMPANVLDSAEIGIEVAIKNDMSTDTSEIVYHLPAKEVDATNRFVVSSDSSESGPIPIYGSNYYFLTYYYRTYLKVGDVYQYGVKKKMLLPNSINLFEKFSINTGIAKYYSYNNMYNYISPYRTTCVAVSYDESLLTSDLILEAEKKGETIKQQEVSGYYHKKLGKLNVYSKELLSNDSTATIPLTCVNAAYIGKFYYCECYFLTTYENGINVPVRVKMGEIKCR